MQTLTLYGKHTLLLVVLGVVGLCLLAAVFASKKITSATSLFSIGDGKSSSIAAAPACYEETKSTKEVYFLSCGGFF